MVLTCHICHKKLKTVSFDRDDPVLTCGHIQRVSGQKDRDEIREGLYVAMRDEVYAIMRSLKISYDEAVQAFWEENYEA